MLENEVFPFHTVILKEERNILPKVGEIFHVENDIFKLQCNECLSEFFDFSEFVAHVRIHSNFFHNDSQDVFESEKNELDFDNAVEDDECEIEKQSILENEIKVEPVWSPSAVPIEYETEHTSEIPRTKKYSCHRCPRVYRRKFSLKRHLENHFGVEYSCSKCFSTFHRKDILQRHIKQSCQRKSKNTLRKANAMKELIPELLQINSNQSKADCLRLSCVPTNGEFKCSICLQTYRYKFSLKRHIEQHFGKEFSCTTCDAKFHRKDLLQRHIHQSCNDR